jgi:hypothetical protein
MVLKNIDSFINELGYDMVKAMCGDGKLMGFIDRALGVLVNDGVYAYYVFCRSQKESKTKEIFIKKVIEKINEMDDFKNYFSNNQIQTNNNKHIETFFQSLSSDLHKLLFFRDILEQALIYARYHAKAYQHQGDANE